MKNIINHPVFKFVTFGLFFLFVSITLFYDYTLISSFFVPNTENVYYYLPTFVAYLLPSVSLIFYFYYIHNLSVKKQWGILCIYVFVIGLASLLTLAGSITVAVIGEYEVTSLQNVFPYDAMALSVLYLASVAIIFAYAIKNRANCKVVDTVKRKPRLYARVVSPFLILFAAFFFGDFLSIINLVDKPYDENFPLMIPIFLMLLYGTIEVVLYAIYRNIKDPDTRFVFYKNSLFFFTIIYLFLNTFVVAVIMVNLNIFRQSMMSFFPSERYLSFPIGVVAAGAVPLGPIVYACIRFGITKNEQKQKESDNKI